MAIFSNIDFRKLAYDSTPHFLRRTNAGGLNRFLAFSYAFIKGLKDVNVSFNSFRSFQLYCLSFTGQKIYLQEWLNQNYDPVGKNIVIVDQANIVYRYFRRKVEQRPPIYIYRKSEGQPAFYMKTHQEQAANIHFIIEIPFSVVFDEDVLREQLKKWVLFSRNYEIVIV